MRKIIHFIGGSAQIRLEGAFPERFLNLCGTARLLFWDVERENDHVLYLTLPVWQLRRARALAERAMCALTVEQRFGLPAFLYRFRRRYALAAGLVFALFCAVILSQFVWVIEVTGNSAVPNSVILTELDSLGFGIGSYGPGVDCRALANQALLDLRELSFLSVNISGVYAEVVVREATPAPEVEDPTAAADIVAAVDGVVVDVDTVRGRTQVEEGQAVLAGEILISGLETYESGDGSGAVLSSRQVRAEGDVWALTNRTLRSATPLTAETRAGETVRTLYSLKILKRSVKFYQNSGISDLTCGKIKKVYALTLPGGTVLPLAWEKLTVATGGLTSASVDRASAEDYLTGVLETRLSALLGEEGQLLSSQITFAETDGVLTGALRASCLEQIGRTVELEN
ncbi:MAG: sporulation protein YqfD [Clostridiales bacterium]|nr:sporulation protein YqfD [Clostridiales bacterium]